VGAIVGSLLVEIVCAIVGDTVDRAVGPLNSTLLGKSVGSTIVGSTMGLLDEIKLGDIVGTVKGDTVGNAVRPMDTVVIGKIVGSTRVG
jgi:hypothetical protein